MSRWLLIHSFIGTQRVRLITTHSSIFESTQSLLPALLSLSPTRYHFPCRRTTIAIMRPMVSPPHHLCMNVKHCHVQVRRGQSREPKLVQIHIQLTGDSVRSSESVAGSVSRSETGSQLNRTYKLTTSAACQVWAMQGVSAYDHVSRILAGFPQISHSSVASSLTKRRRYFTSSLTHVTSAACPVWAARQADGMARLGDPGMRPADRFFFSRREC